MLLMISALIAGLVFGLGLMVSGMANPVKVLGFLDIAGQWDPSLALVMVGAIFVAAIAFSIARQRSRSFLNEPLQLPTARHIDRKLLIGSALFGIGWGIAGICPGPALVALGMGQGKVLVFVIAMLVGMLAFQWLDRK